MKKSSSFLIIIVTLSLVVSIANNSNAQTIQFENWHSLSMPTEVKTVCELTDSTVIVISYEEFMGTKAILYHFSKNGSFIKSKTMMANQPLSSLSLPNGNFLMTALKDSFSMSGPVKVSTLYEINNKLDVVRQVSFGLTAGMPGGPMSQYFTQTLITASGGGYLVLSPGDSVLSGSPGMEPLVWGLTKFDSDLKKIWFKKIETQLMDYSRLVLNQSAGYLFIADAKTTGLSVKKLDNDGDIVATKMTDTMSDGYVRGIISILNDLYVYGGKTSDVFITKCDADLNTKWTKTYSISGQTLFPSVILKTANNELLFTTRHSKSGSPFQLTGELGIFKADTSGTITASKIVEPFENYYRNVVCGINASEGYIFAGMGGSSVYLLKTGNDPFNFCYRNTNTSPDICMVTYDKKSNRNMVLWHKYPGPIAYYKIINQQNIPPRHVGTVYANEDPIFIDTLSDPSSSNIYTLIMVDSCGFEYPKGKVFENITITFTTLSSNSFQFKTTGLRSQMGMPYSGKVYLYRGMNADSMQLLKTYTDVLIFEDEYHILDGSRYYYQIVLDDSCQGYVRMSNIIRLPAMPRNICIVTVDPLSGRNLIAWDRRSYDKVKHFNVYKETFQADVYAKIATVPFDSVSVFVDSASVPAQRSNRYKLSYVDIEDKESPLSEHHKTIHLTASKGTGNEVNLIWSHYEGFPFSSYKIYRSQGFGQAFVLIDSVPSNLSSYSDLNPGTGLVLYQVSVMKSDTCFPELIRAAANKNTGPFSQSISNIRDYHTTATAYLEVSNDSLLLDYHSGNRVIDLFTSQLVWSASSDQSWLSLTVDEVAKRIYVSFTENQGTAARSANITVSSAGLADKVIPVMQYSMQGIEDRDAAKLKIYPVPANGKVIVIVPENIHSDYNFELYAVDGRLIRKTDHLNQVQLEVDISDLDNGMYFIRVIHDSIYHGVIIKK